MKRSPLIRPHQGRDASLLPSVLIVDPNDHIPEANDVAPGTLLVEYRGSGPLTAVTWVGSAAYARPGHLGRTWYGLSRHELTSREIASLKNASRQLPALKGWLDS